ncbi:Hypothetical Protein FCC1311_028142 [Hondaea fermentalgiana]|uniref:TIGR00341 family protein n=1 Tax=Hondaea fermentalgiana TaxID=2315210 RepID=A0A2R5GD84_9STRA|nr:Hypothetical Protein FCC1311_028142 [Hondaea fermentalgiana]|eukprot:GBG26593.1 Hypothetical Protein FCC1311_028142 [Hondaea fermentalgiana]
MVRSVQIHLPRDEREQVEKVIRANPNAQRLRTFATLEADEVMISFVCVDKHVSEVLHALESTGLGSSFGSIDIIALQSTIPTLQRPPGPRKRYRLTDRRTVREIEDAIHAGLHLTFDYILLTCVAGIIAAVGLVTDSAVTVVASMLVSPLMGPILGVAFGIAVGRRDLVRLGLRNELWGILICYILGAAVGCVTILFWQPLGIPFLTHLTGHQYLTSEEMESRGRVLSMFTGFWTAMPSGIGVALATTNAAVSTLVGVAISSSLLPPLVNSAICITMGGIYHLAQVDAQGRDIHFLRIGIFSLSLFLVNFATIIVFAVITFRIKGVSGANVELSFAGLVHGPIQGLKNTFKVIRAQRGPSPQDLSAAVGVGTVSVDVANDEQMAQLAC